MKLHTLLFALCLITSSLAFTTQTQAQTQSGDFGLGVILGEPTGLSAKVFQGNNRAFALGAAWSFGNEAKPAPACRLPDPSLRPDQCRFRQTACFTMVLVRGHAWLTIRILACVSPSV